MPRPPDGPGFFGPLVKIVLGAGLVLVVAYVVSKLRDARGQAARLEKLEKMAEKLAREATG